MSWTAKPAAPGKLTQLFCRGTRQLGADSRRVSRRTACAARIAGQMQGASLIPVSRDCSPTVPAEGSSVRIGGLVGAAKVASLLRISGGKYRWIMGSLASLIQSDGFLSGLIDKGAVWLGLSAGLGSDIKFLLLLGRELRFTICPNKLCIES